MKENKNQYFKSNSVQWLKLTALISVCLIFIYSSSSCSTHEEKKPTELPSLPTSSEIVKTMAEDMKGMDFSKFKHDGQQHQRLACALCHERKEGMTKPKLAGHTACSSCHVQQFEDKSNAICTVCHTNKDTGEVKEFPQMASFNVQFNHEAHFKETNCATCHQSQSGGGMTIPAGGEAHANCFQCHTPDKVVAEKNIGSCSTCHQAGTPDRIIDSAKSIGFSFNHSSHSKLDCQSCHNSTGNNKMSAITVAMHGGQTNSCASCHNEKRAFGANDFSDCRQCHQEVGGAKSFGVSFDHSDHNKTNCATCHKSGGKGVNFTVPNGEAAHTTCFQCHSPMKDSKSFTSSKCFQCHQIGGKNDITPSSAVIDGNFSHTKHKAMDCSSCHTNKGGEMNAPTVAMHKASKSGVNCATCHNNQKAFGGEDFTNCKRCHTGGNFKF